MEDATNNITNKDPMITSFVDSMDEVAVSQEHDFNAKDAAEIDHLQKDIEQNWKKSSDNIAPKLYRLAELLHAPGRSGKGFRSFLAEIGLPKTTAYRWIDEYAKTVGKPALARKEAKTSSHSGHTSSKDRFEKLQKQIKLYLDGISEHKDAAAKQLIEFITKQVGSEVKQTPVAAEAYKAHVDNPAA